MRADIQTVLADTETLRQTVARLATQITDDYKDKRLCLVCVLKGSLPFMADLMRQIELPLMVETMRVSSYGAATKSGGKVEIREGLVSDLSGYDVLLVEDIVDSGRTMAEVLPMLRARGAASVEICTLLDKPERREVDLYPKYVGLVIPDAFVVGYGLDYAERYRNLPYVGVLKPAVYETAN